MVSGFWSTAVATLDRWVDPSLHGGEFVRRVGSAAAEALGRGRRLGVL